jgi:hypothetical protein
MTRATQVRVAYAGYLVSAGVMALLGWELRLSGPEVLKMFGYFLLPLVVATIVAIGFAWGAHTPVLRVLSVLTVGVGVFLLFDGMFGLAIRFAVPVAFGHVAAVCLGFVYGWRDWWPLRR